MLKQRFFKIIAVALLVFIGPFLIVNISFDAGAVSGCSCEGGFFSEGNGTVNSPYVIKTLEELRHIEVHPSSHYVLGSSIDLGRAGEWKPLCSEAPFSGSLDGKNKIISNMNISEGSLGGLFAVLSEDAVIQHLNISGSIEVGNDMTCAGGIAAISKGIVSEIVSDVKITVSKDASAEIGGIVGFNGGLVRYSTYNSIIINNGDGENDAIGAIIGHSEVTNTSMLATMITAHAGFGAKNDPESLKRDNTIDNIIHAINYGPDVVEVDVRGIDSNNDGKLEIWLGHDSVDVKNGVRLEEVLNMLIGQHARYGELNPDYASTVRIQLDAKNNGILDEIFSLIDELQFPYARIIMAGDNKYDHVVDNIDKIRAAVLQGMDFWMNPNFILSYDAMKSQTYEFIDRILALDLPRFTVNSSYSNMSEDIQHKLNEEGIQISVWTLNTEELLSAHMTRGLYNITTRLQDGLLIRDAIRASGTLGNTFEARKGYPEVALCTVAGESGTDTEAPGEESPEDTDSGKTESEPANTAAPETEKDPSEQPYDENTNDFDLKPIFLIVAVFVVIITASVFLILKKRRDNT